MTKSAFLPTFFAAALLLSCATKDENTLVGSGYVGERPWAVPVASESLAVVLQDTWFEAAIRPGTQDDLLLGSRRKLRFWTAVYFDTLPKGDVTLVSASLTAVPWYAEGSAAARIERIDDAWSETSASETLATTGSVEAPVASGLSAALPVEWVRTWIDSSAERNGLLVRLGDEEDAFFRFPSRESDSTEGGERFRLHVVFTDTSGAESTLVSSARLDRFYSFKAEEGSYVDENMDAETLLVGMRESLTNQLLFEILLPEEIGDATVNKAELILTVAEAVLEEDGDFALLAYLVANDTLAGDSIVIENSLLGSEVVSPETSPGDTVSLILTEATRGWFADREWNRRILVRSSAEEAREFNLRFHAEGPSVPDSLRPRFRLIYTPLRPDHLSGAGKE